MSKAEVLVQMSGFHNGEQWPRRGSVIELPDAEAAEYARAGIVRLGDEGPAKVSAAKATKADAALTDEIRAAEDE